MYPVLTWDLLYSVCIFDDTGQHNHVEKREKKRHCTCERKKPKENFLVARMLHDRNDLTVVTNSLRAASELAEMGPRVILTGGELRRISQTMVGPLTSAVLGQVRVDKAFMGTMGFCLTNGLTTTDPNEAYVKNLVAEHANQVILLADSSKAEKVCFARVSDWDKVDSLISDDKLPQSFVKSLRKRGPKVQIV